MQERQEWTVAAGDFKDGKIPQYDAAFHRNQKIESVKTNPTVMLGYAQMMVGQKPAQVIQPWQFGHQQMKATCLWLRGLPELQATDVVGPPPADTEKRKMWQDVWRHAPTKDPNERRMARSKTFEGIADAMAAQWGDFIVEQLAAEAA